MGDKINPPEITPELLEQIVEESRQAREEMKNITCCTPKSVLTRLDKIEEAIRQIEARVDDIKERQGALSDNIAEIGNRTAGLIRY